MPRNLATLSDQTYDVLVVGGGIHGLFTAYDAALRGLRVALVERHDFGSGLSFNHQRTIHGGLRTLEGGRLLKTRRLIAERRTWARIAPHLLRPLPFLIGTYRFSKRSRSLIRAGFKLYDVVGRRRNQGVSPELHLPRAKLESAAATRRLFPGVAERGLTGGAVWYDYQTRHPDRLTWTVALGAEQASARLANYAEAVAPLTSNGRVTGARIRDVLTGDESEVNATVTVLSTGGALGTAMTRFGASDPPPMLRAMNLLLDRPARDIATAAPGPDGRMLTVVPWAGHVLVGTAQSASIITEDEARPPEEAIAAFLTDANATFPTLEATRKDVRLVHHGLTPAVVRRGRPELLAESEVRRGPAGLISIVGVKYTTARLTAAAAVDAVSREVPAARGRTRTADAALPHAGIADVEGRLLETVREHGLDLDRDVIDHLAGWYATEASDIVAFSAEQHLMSRIAPACPILTGEIAYAVEHAHAVRLRDAVLRRTPLGSAGHPGREALESAANVMAARLGWSDEQRAAELEDVDAFFG